MRIDRTSRARLLPAALLAMAAIAGACTGSPAASPASTDAVGPAPVSTATPAGSVPKVFGTPATPVPADGANVPQGILDAIIADAAARTGVAPADITVVTAKAVTWPNGALGCPQPGFMYTEMIEPGYQVVVEAAGKQLDYRVGSGGAPNLCENPPGPG